MYKKEFFLQMTANFLFNLLLIQDEIEQIHRINVLEKQKTEGLQQRSNAKQIQLQQWKQNHFKEYGIEEQYKLKHEEIEELQPLEKHQELQETEQ